MMENRSSFCFQVNTMPPHGFSLVELLIAMVVGLIAIGSLYSVYICQLRIHSHQTIKISLQQNLRSAMIILEQEIRMAGFDPEDTGSFGIVDVRRYDLIGTGQKDNGSPALFYTLDEDENGRLEGGEMGRNKEHCSILIRDDSRINRRYLAWNRGMGREPLAENIQAVGFAYAVDVDDDGLIDRYKNRDDIIWAVASGENNELDVHLDSNGDGKIDDSDDRNGDGRITRLDGCPIDPPVSIKHIKAVRIWLLAQSNVRLKNYADNSVYVVGDQLYPAADNGYVRLLMETVVNCRNL